MRTTFFEICLFNDVSQKHYTSFILNGKEWGVGKTEGEREKKIVRFRVCEEKGCGMGHKTCPLARYL